MSNARYNYSSLVLLGLIPFHCCTPEQVPKWFKARESPTYVLLRDPNGLHEFNQHEHEIAIWRDNHTLTYVSPPGNVDSPVYNERYLTLKLGPGRPKIYIVGQTDQAVAETAAFFMNLDTRVNSPSLEGYTGLYF
jgi:hypothetical protein